MMRQGIYDFLAVSLAKVLNGGLTVIFNLLLLRHFGPEQFGIFSLCVVFIQLVDGILGSSLDMGVMQFSTGQKQELNKGEFSEAEIATIFLKCLLVLLNVAVLPPFADQIGQLFFHQAELTALIWLTAFAALGLLFLRSYQVHCQLHGQFFRYGISDIIHSCLKFGSIAALLVWTTPKLEWILMSFAFAPSSVAVIGLVFTFVAVRQGIGNPLNSIWRLVLRIKWVVATFILTASVSRLDVFFLQKYATLEEVGIFSGGMILASIPELLGSYVAVVLNPKVKRYCQEGRFLTVFRNFQLLCLLAGAVGGIAAFFALEPMCAYILPEKFSGSAKVLLVLLPGSLVSMAIFPLTLPYLLMIRPRFFLIMDCIVLPLLLVLYIPAIQQYGAIGAAMVTAAVKVLKGVVAQLMAWWLASQHETVQLTDTESVQ